MTSIVSRRASGATIQTLSKWAIAWLIVDTKRSKAHNRSRTIDLLIATPMNQRIALIAFIIALLVILGLGCYRAAIHEESSPATGPPASASTAQRS